jgi:hypothetical protein
MQSAIYLAPCSLYVSFAGVHNQSRFSLNRRKERRGFIPMLNLKMMIHDLEWRDEGREF